MISAPSVESAGQPAKGPALEFRNVDKRFGGTHALRDVSLAVELGPVHAIVGENGAGKSTLVKIVAGVLPYGEYEGELFVHGQERQFSGVADAEKAGIYLVPQELNVVPNLSVADNLYLNREPSRFGVLDDRTLWSETASWLETFRVDVLPTTPMRRLSAGQQQLIKIAHAMSKGVQTLILDEPTASLTERETELLFDRLGELRRRGVTAIYITHRLDELPRVAEFVTIMRDGRIVETVPVASTSPRRIVRGMVGRDIEDMYPKTSTMPGEVVLEITGLSVESPVQGRPRLVDDVSLDVRRGEIVGLFGAIGSGTAQFCAAVFGARQGGVSGSVKVNGRQIAGGPRNSIRGGLGLISDDRKRTGLVFPMSVGANMSLAALDRFSQAGFIDRQREIVTISGFVDRLRIKSDSTDRSVASLSGGNQQKVVAAKWLMLSPEVLILHEPTQGIDVGAKVEMYSLMGALAQEGRALLLVSSDIQEIVAMSDRIVVLYRGAVAGRWDSASASEDALSAAASGGRLDD